MRRAIVTFAATVVGLVLLLSFKTHSTATTLTTPPAALANPAGSASTGSGGGSGSGSGGSASGSTTVTGDAVDTQFGPVQVKITITNGQLTAADAVEYPTERSRDIEINSYAIPQLNQEAVAAKSAQIDTISGATYTSEGYISSLQSALDKAHG